jgi:uncharacterized protein YndB with AHSA1/START domain
MTDADVVEVRMRIAAKPATVFRFLSDPDRFGQWMGNAALGAGVGGPIVVNYPDGSSAIGEIEEIVPGERLVFSWGYDRPERGIAPKSTRVAIQLTPIPTGTLVTLRHSGIPRDERRGHAMGWRHYLSALSNVAASVAGLAEPAVDAYQRAWAERDAAKRDELLSRCWSQDAVFRDSMGYAEGRRELADYIDAAQRFAPDVKLERVGPLLQSHSYINYRWRMVAPNGAVVMTGNNVGELSPDGVFLNMTGFWEPATPAPA